MPPTAHPRLRRIGLLAAAVLLVSLLPAVPAAAEVPHVLVFSGTYGFRHDSITTGNEVLQQLAEETGAFTVEVTENPLDLSAATLADADILLLNSTTGRFPLTAGQRREVERFWGCGGGAIGVHAATDANYGWSAYAELFSAQFQSHPHGANAGEARLFVENHDHPVNAAYEGVEEILHSDEFYRWVRDVREVPGLTPLLSLDETTVAAGGPGSANAYAERQPLSWVKTFRDRGRVYNNNLGHNAATWQLEHFQQTLVDGIAWVSEVPLDQACFTGDEPLPAPPVAPAPEWEVGDPVEPCVVEEGQALLTRDGMDTTIATPSAPAYFGASIQEYVLDLGHPLHRADLDVELSWDNPAADYDLAVSVPWTIAGSDAAQPLAGPTESVRHEDVTSCAVIHVAAYNHLAATPGGDLRLRIAVDAPPAAPTPPVTSSVPAELGVPIVTYPTSQADGRFLLDDAYVVEGSSLSLWNASFGETSHNVYSRDADPVTLRPLFRTTQDANPGDKVLIEGVEDLAPGDYRFFCGLHGQMEGVLHVLPAPALAARTL